MVSQEEEEGTCACHQESLQTVNEQPSSDCAATGNDLAASACLVAFGLCREHKTLWQNSSWGGKRAGKAAGKDLLRKKHTGNAETVSFLLSLTRLSTPTRHLAVGSSLPLEPQESSIDQTLSLLHSPAHCKGTHASQQLSALGGQHRFFLSC